MKLESDIFPLELGRARNARREWDRRPGLLLRVRGEGGVEGWGEASPLPGFSTETLAAAASVISRWQSRDLSLDLAGQDPVATIEEHLQQLSAAAPSARFAIESALLDIASKCAGQPVQSLLSGDLQTRGAEDHLAIMLGPVLSVDLTRLERHLEAGVTTFKIKIGSVGGLRAELARLDWIRGTLGESVQIRVDANGCLTESRNELLEALDRLADLGVELVEEPLAGSDLLRVGSSRVPLAVDETLLKLIKGEIAHEELWASAIEVLVLKPMLLGGLLECRRLAMAAARCGKRWIVSHLFDGPIAMAGCCALARSLPRSGLAMGLAQHSGMQRSSEQLAVDGLGIASLHDSERAGLPLRGRYSP